MQRAVLVCQNQWIEGSDVVTETGPAEPPGMEGGFVSLAEQEKRYIAAALEATGGVIYGAGGAAHLLHLNPNTLRSKMRKYGLRRLG